MAIMISNVSTSTSLVDPSYTNVATTTDVTDTATDTATDVADTTTDTAEAADSANETETTSTTSQAATTDSQVSNTNSDSVTVSSRAQKLSALASEFFNGSSMDSIDINQLVERAYEYGLLSSTQYNSLGGGQAVTEDESGATESVVQYIDDLKANLDTFGEDQMFGEISLIELQAALDDSREIITNVNMTQDNTSLLQVIAESKLVLAEAFESEEFSNMSKEDQLTMESVIKTLSVIEDLNTPQSDTSTNSSANSAVNAYTNVALY